MNGDKFMVAFKNGDQATIEYIYKTHFRPLCYFARGFVNNKEEAEDIVVDAFIKLLKKRNDFDSVINIKGFLFTATRNACLDFLKHVKRKTESHKALIYLMQKDEDFIQSKIIKAELLKLILDEVEHLPVIRKKIFKMIFIEELSTAEIAEKLGITVDTVRVQKGRAIASIRTAILKDKLLLFFFMWFVNRFP